jgi:spore coat protein CotH
VVENGLPLKKSKLTLGVLFSVLLLVGMLSTVVQVGADNAEYWEPADKVIDEASAFFDDSYIHEIRLYFDDPNWYDTLYDAHDDDPEDPYFPARFVSHGIEIETIGARFKGLSTFGFGGGFFAGGGGGGGWNPGGEEEEPTDIKKPFRLDFNMYDPEGVEEETTFFGLKKLNLNNEALDPTMMREKLFMDFASKYVPTPRSVYTRVYVNDEYYGLYLAMEHIDNTYVESRFGKDEDGNIYKVDKQGTLSYNGSDPAGYINYEQKNNDETPDCSDIIELADILTNTPTEQLPEKLEPIFDVEQALYSIAMLDLFVDLDSYIGNARNYFLYDRSDTGKIVHLLWDANLAFGNFGLGMGATDDPAEYDIIPPTTVSGMGFFGGGGSEQTLALTESLMAVESYQREYLRILAQMLREGFGADSMNVRIQELADLIRDEVNNSPNMQTEPEEFEPGLTETLDFVQSRVAYVNAQLDTYATKSDLHLNDLMTVNYGTIADNMGDYDPWVELYNLGPGLVSTSGLFLTDDSDVPNKWALPTQNLDDGEFMLLWLDGESSEGADHASFSINLEGGDLYLYLRQGSSYVLVDSVSYPELDIDTSFGRFPDGDGMWLILTELITPAFANQVNDVPDDLFINEFMANNDNAVADPYDDYPDWIELYNGGSTAIDLGGMYMTSDLDDPMDWQFPANTVIPAGGFLVIWADNLPDRGSLHAGFRLNASGEAIGLFAADGETVIDSVIFGQQFSDISYGRLPDGSSNWEYLTPTSGSSNSLGESVDVSSIGEVPEDLFINELMANNGGSVESPNGTYSDWIELYNGGSEAINLGGMYLTDDLGDSTDWKFPSGTVIEAGGYLVIWADSLPDSGLLHASFSLSANGEEVGLFASDGVSLIDSVVFDAQPSDVSYGRLPDGTSNWTFLTPTPGLENKEGNSTDGPTEPVDSIPEGLVINEFMADNGATIMGPDASYPDWIELYNGGNESVTLDGMYLTDDLNNPLAWKFPDDTTIEAGGFLIIWADSASDYDGLHCGFGLRANGESIALFATDGITVIDSITYLKQLQDVSYGRLPDGADNWEHMLSATPGWANNERPPYDVDSSVFTILLLLGAVAGVAVLFVVITKFSEKRR